MIFGGELGESTVYTSHKTFVFFLLLFSVGKDYTLYK